MVCNNIQANYPNCVLTTDSRIPVQVIRAAPVAIAIQ